MPTYDYKCKACGGKLERFQSMKDAPIRKCPACGKSTLERLIGTGAAVLFKGSGFYQTDYRSDSYKKSAKAESDAGKPAKAVASSGENTSKPATGDVKPAPPKPENKPAATGKKSNRKDE